MQYHTAKYNTIKEVSVLCKHKAKRPIYYTRGFFA